MRSEIKKPAEPKNSAPTGVIPIPSPAPKMFNPAEQKQLYDIGVKFYSEEKYLDAKKAWGQVIEMNATTDLALKAQEHLKKVDQMLKTLETIEHKNEKQGETSPASPKKNPNQENLSR